MTDVSVHLRCVFQNKNSLLMFLFLHVTTFKIIFLLVQMLIIFLMSTIIFQSPFESCESLVGHTFPDIPSPPWFMTQRHGGILTRCPWWGQAQITQSAIFAIATYYLTAGEWGLLLAESEPQEPGIIGAQQHRPTVMANTPPGGQQPSHTVA